jgi:hypothetical protein
MGRPEYTPSRRGMRVDRLKRKSHRDREERRTSYRESRKEGLEEAQDNTIYQMDIIEGGESLQEPTIEEPSGDSVQNEADSQSPQSPITAQADRQAEGVDKKAAKNEKRAQKAQERRAKAEAFRVTHTGTSLVKANQKYDDPDNSRWTRLGRRVTKIKHRKF